MSVYSKYRINKTDEILDIKACQKHLAKTLKVFMEFCDEFNLKPFLIWGTVLGAARNNKIIPWDDDIDLGINQNGFDKLLSMKEEIEKRGLIFSYYKQNKHLHSNLIRIHMDGLYQVCSSNFNDFLTPIYIDIFCCRTIDNYSKLNIKRLNKIKKIGDALILKETKYKSKNILKAILREVKKIPLYFVSSLYLHKKMDYICSKISLNDNAEEVFFADTLYSNNFKLYKRSFFDDLIRIDFEGVNCWVSRDYKELLNRIYGNWETPYDRSSGEIYNSKFIVKKLNN